MRLSHRFSASSVVFDDPNLVSAAGLVPVLGLAEAAGLSRLVGEHLRVPGDRGANPAAKVVSVLAGMGAGADSIDDLALLRHGGMGRLFTGVRAPSTVGSFLRAFSFGNVSQLDAVASRFLTGLAARAPLLAGAELTYLDIDDTIRATYGHAKQGVEQGYSGVRGLNALLATISTPLTAPVIAGARLRRGNVNSTRGAGQFLTRALRAATRAGLGAGVGAGVRAGALVVVRADSAYYTHDVIAAARRGGARFSVTARRNPAVLSAISGIDQDAWTPIRYPQAIWDPDQQRWISDAEVAEVAFTAFTRRPRSEQVTGRLIVRRVRRLNPTSVPAGQQELFATYRHHAVFTDSPLPMLQAEAAHRGHAVVEQVIADLKSGPLAHLPSGSFSANSAWLILATMTFNLLRAAGTLASTFHAKATTATIRTQLINVPARLARSARRLRLHLPQHWPWQTAWENLLTTGCGPPPATTP